MARGYSEMASDALLDNSVSHAAHNQLGYEEVGRVVQFRKVLLGSQRAAPSNQYLFFISNHGS